MLIILGASIWVASKCIVTFGVAGSAFGPFIFALDKELLESYRSITLLTAVLPLAVAVLAPFMRPLVLNKSGG